MKKVLGILFVLVLLAQMAGCGLLAFVPARDEGVSSSDAVSDVSEEDASIDISSEAPSSKEDESSSDLEPKEIPLKIKSVKIEENSIGTPEVYVQVKNESEDTVDAYNVYIQCFDAYDEPVKGFSVKDMFNGTSDVELKPGKSSPSGYYWTLYGFDAARTFKVAIFKYHTKDGETVELSESELTWVEAKK